MPVRKSDKEEEWERIFRPLKSSRVRTAFFAKEPLV